MAPTSIEQNSGFFRRNHTEKAPGPYCILYDDNWNDWYKYETMFSLYFVTAAGESSLIGYLKIASEGLTVQTRRPDVPMLFDILPDNYYSVGQSEDYYQSISNLPKDIREKILSGLRDISFENDRLERFKDDYAMTESLLRSVQISNILGRFNRLAFGDATLTPFHFEIPINHWSGPVQLSFDVVPGSLPSTNVHVLIGRNGVGKTTTLRNYMETLFREEPKTIIDEIFSEDSSKRQGFSNLVAIAFSAFDPFIPIPDGAKGINGLRFAYVGLRPEAQSPEDSVQLAPKGLASLAQEFVQSVKICKQGVKAERWLSALEILQSDPLFSDADIAELVRQSDEEARSLFLRLSAGHRIVLLSITRLVEFVEERSLVVMDEPESHLHPPLLSAFVRALSELLARRNGVAVIATHSPVILQEVPGRCVWMIRRSGETTNAERPQIETFGESVGVLTREVFGLEVAKSGFNKLVSDLVARHSGDYDEFIKLFGGQLGSEARVLTRSLLAQKAEK